MHPKYIVAALYSSEVPPTKLAKRLRVHRATVSNVIYGNAKSRRIAKEISRVTGHAVSELWPGSYPALELDEIRGAA